MSSSAVSYIVEKKQKENEDIKRRLADKFRREDSDSDEEIARLLADYSVSDIKLMLDGVVKDKEISKGTKTYVVAHITRNQPHAIEHFEDFYDWNKDLWQGVALRPLLWVLGSGLGVMLGMFIFLGVEALGGNMDFAASAAVYATVWFMGGSVFYGVAKKKRMLFINPAFIYKNRLTESFEAIREREEQEQADRKKQLQAELERLESDEGSTAPSSVA